MQRPDNPNRYHKPTLLEMLQNAPISNFLKSLLTLTLRDEEMVNPISTKEHRTKKNLKKKEK